MIQENKKALILFLCVFVMLGIYAAFGFVARNNLKKQCGIGIDCTCFEHIVDNRLSRKQIRGFTMFLGEIKKRSTANILEFVDEDDALVLSKVFSICRLDVPTDHDSNNHDSNNQ